MTNRVGGRTPPDPDGLPLVGSLPEYARDPFDFERRVHREYGDVVRWKDPGGWVYHLANPEHVEHVLVRNNQNYVKGEAFQQTLGPVTGNGLLNREEEFWRRQRHLIEPAFHPERISTNADMMVDVTERRIDGWRDGDVRDVHAEMTALTLGRAWSETSSRASNDDCRGRERRSSTRRLTGVPLSRFRQSFYLTRYM